LAALSPEALLIRYRSAEPVLQPELPQERSGTIANVVFPTGIDRRDDLGCPDRFDIYYGMADTRSAWRAWTCRSCCRLGGRRRSAGGKSVTYRTACGVLKLRSAVRPPA